MILHNRNLFPPNKSLNLQYIHCPVRANQTYINTLTCTTRFAVSSTFSFSVGLHRLTPQHSITTKKEKVLAFLNTTLQQSRPSGFASWSNNKNMNQNSDCSIPKMWELFLLFCKAGTLNIQPEGTWEHLTDSNNKL